MSKGQATRQRILDAAQAAILERGFTAMSLEALIAECGLTKGGFFHHFRDKGDLAHALLRRYAHEDTTFEAALHRASELVDDPLQVLLVTLRLFAEILADLEATNPALAVALSCHTERIFDREGQALHRALLEDWTERFRALVDRILLHNRPRTPADPQELAMMISTVFEGALVMARVLRDPGVAVRQMLTLRAMVKALFVAIPDD